jgi:hypothetical protein
MTFDMMISLVLILFGVYVDVLAPLARFMTIHDNFKDSSCLIFYSHQTMLEYN